MIRETWQDKRSEPRNRRCGSAKVELVRDSQKHHGDEMRTRKFSLSLIVKMAIVIGMGLLFTANTAKSSEFCSQTENEYVKSMFECNLEIISWVEVNFQSELLKKHKSKYERLIRLRLRNDLSMIKHETLKYLDALKKFQWDTKSPEISKRGQLTCLVWTVGDDFPVAQYVECELWGYGDYSYYPNFSHKTLGYSNSSGADEHVREAIRDIITEISSSFLEARDFANQWKLPYVVECADLPPYDPRQNRWLACRPA